MCDWRGGTVHKHQPLANLSTNTNFIDTCTTKLIFRTIDSKCNLQLSTDLIMTILMQPPSSHIIHNQNNRVRASNNAQKAEEVRVIE